MSILDARFNRKLSKRVLADDWLCVAKKKKKERRKQNNSQKKQRKTLYEFQEFIATNHANIEGWKMVTSRGHLGGAVRKAANYNPFLSR